MLLFQAVIFVVVLVGCSLGYSQNPETYDLNDHNSKDGKTLDGNIQKINDNVYQKTKSVGDYLPNFFGEYKKQENPMETKYGSYRNYNNKKNQDFDDIDDDDASDKRVDSRRYRDSRRNRDRDDNDDDVSSDRRLDNRRLDNRRLDNRRLDDRKFYYDSEGRLRRRNPGRHFRGFSQYFYRKGDPKSGYGRRRYYQFYDKEGRLHRRYEYFYKGKMQPHIPPPFSGNPLSQMPNNGLHISQNKDLGADEIKLS